MKDALQQLESAASNLAQYLHENGDAANMLLVAAQVDLIKARLDIVRGVRTESGSLVGG